MKIEIEWLEDTYECDDCGTSWAEGALVKLNGAEILNLEPHAHCYDGDDWDRKDVYKAILNHLGYNIEEN